MTSCSVHHLAKRFRALTALRDVSFDVRSGEVLGLLGPNGAGKTTLLACMAGLLAPDSGMVRANDRELSGAERRDMIFYLADGIAPWGAQPASWLLPFAEVVFGPMRTEHPTRDGRRGPTSEVSRDELMADILTVLRIDDLGDQRIDTLSKGQRKRLLLAMALLTPHPVLLLDEPFDGLDVRLTRDVIALLRRIAEAGRSLVLSIHAMHDAARVCHRIVLLDDGRSVAQGSLDELRARVNLPGAQLDEIVLALV